MVTRRALVTGATGGLGRVLVRQLIDAGYDVVATGRDRATGAALERPGATFRAADLCDADLHPLLDRVAVVFHLAALTAPWGPKRDFAAINVAATARLLAAARTRGCDRFVYASTPSIYAERRARLGVSEASPIARHFPNAYVHTKYEAEQLVLAASASSMPTVVLRPKAIVGPDDRVLLPRLLRVVRSGRVALPGGGGALVELTDVRDAAAAFMAADRSLPAAGRAINISGGAPRTVRAIVDRVCATLGLAPNIVAIPTFVALAAAGAAEIGGRLRGKEPALTRYAVMAVAYSQTFDLARARALLDWHPRHSPEQAIDDALIRWSPPCVS